MESTLFERNSGLIEARVDDQLVMMDIDSGTYYGLDQVGIRVWECLENPIAIADLVKTLRREFDVSELQCVSEVSVYLRDLVSKGLIREVS
ncbi:PqqD family peptide modification chaperone [Marinomonas mediterranea]|uniref:PqqD family peptide modification chaperone n=1 Tax=Marinomonas mediterranea TaxID=119864 RepID=UPI00234A5C70|nr:PqqD family peptide modification chaperone [Marinomonas mediterranea]WCN08582.1 PqqD family peptide modification chaperone [Marinomonas mediterranea]WCN12636.1 PqqD family peptide modification chaperone [Marinomonas mediterranea]